MEKKIQEVVAEIHQLKLADLRKTIGNLEKANRLLGEEISLVKKQYQDAALDYDTKVRHLKEEELSTKQDKRKLVDRNKHLTSEKETISKTLSETLKALDEARSAIEENKAQYLTDLDRAHQELEGKLQFQLKVAEERHTLEKKRLSSHYQHLLKQKDQREIVSGHENEQFIDLLARDVKNTLHGHEAKFMEMIDQCNKRVGQTRDRVIKLENHVRSFKELKNNLSFKMTALSKEITKLTTSLEKHKKKYKKTLATLCQNHEEEVDSINQKVKLVLQKKERTIQNKEAMIAKLQADFKRLQNSFQ